MSYLTPDEYKKLIPENTRSGLTAKQVWYRKRKAVLVKESERASKMTSMDNLLKEILIVLLKIYYQLKKPKK